MDEMKMEKQVRDWTKCELSPRKMSNIAKRSSTERCKKYKEICARLLNEEEYKKIGFATSMLWAVNHAFSIELETRE